MVFHAWVGIANGLFQALGRSIGAAIIGLSRQIICLIPCVLILSRIFGTYGMASAQAVADIMAIMITLPMVIILLNRIKRIELEQKESEIIYVEKGVNQLQVKPEETVSI